MSFHINNIVEVAFYHLRNIAKIRKYIFLHGIAKYEINKLQSVQNAAAHVIARLSKFDDISDTLKELHWLPVEQRIILFVLRYSTI